MSIMYGLFNPHTLHGPYDHSGAAALVEVEPNVVALKTWTVDGYVSQVPGTHGEFIEVTRPDGPEATECFATVNGGQLVTVCLDPDDAKRNTYTYVLLAMKNG